MANSSNLLPLSAIGEFIYDVERHLASSERYLRELKAMEDADGLTMENQRLELIFRNNASTEQKLPSFSVQLNYWNTLELSANQKSEINALFTQVKRLSVVNSNIMQQVKALLRLYDESEAMAQKMIDKLMHNPGNYY